jgi:hypothetical protein
LAVALDRLLETALSTPGIMDEYGTLSFGEFFVADQTPKCDPAPPRVVLNISGGVLQEVFCDNPRAKIIKVDWDTEGCDPTEKGIVEITDLLGNSRLAAVAEYPLLPLEELAETETLAALEAAGIDWTKPKT